MAIQITGTTALVTGANRGIGRALVEALLERGAAKVYATARNPDGLADVVARFGDRVAHALQGSAVDHAGQAPRLVGLEPHRAQRLR